MGVSKSLLYCSMNLHALLPLETPIPGSVLRKEARESLPFQIQRNKYPNSPHKNRSLNIVITNYLSHRIHSKMSLFGLSEAAGNNLMTLYHIKIHLSAPLPIEYSEIQPPWETLPPLHPYYIESVMLQGEEVKHYFQEKGRVWFHC